MCIIVGESKKSDNHMRLHKRAHCYTDEWAHVSRDGVPHQLGLHVEQARTMLHSFLGSSFSQILKIGAYE